MCCMRRSTEIRVEFDTRPLRSLPARVDYVQGLQHLADELMADLDGPLKTRRELRGPLGKKRAEVAANYEDTREEMDTNARKRSRRLQAKSPALLVEDVDRAKRLDEKIVHSTTLEEDAARLTKDAILEELGLQQGEPLWKDLKKKKKDELVQLLIERWNAHPPGDAEN
jgi:hypothetical protein